MKPLQTEKYLSLEDLPQEIAYHIEFFRVLDGCSVGRSNITTIEAKVQSIIEYQNLLDAYSFHQKSRDKSQVNRQLVEYMMVCVLVINGF